MIGKLTFVDWVMTRLDGCEISDKVDFDALSEEMQDYISALELRCYKRGFADALSI